MTAESRSWVVARRVRGDDGKPGPWQLSQTLLTRDEADHRTRYFRDALGCLCVAVDLDSLEQSLPRLGLPVDHRKT